MKNNEEVTAKIDLPPVTQIGVVVRDMEKSVEYYSRTFGLGPFSPISDLVPDVSSQIKKLILQGVLLPGDKLPPEAELNEQFNVGRQTIREALRILELPLFSHEKIEIIEIDDTSES